MGAQSYTEDPTVRHPGLSRVVLQMYQLERGTVQTAVLCMFISYGSL